MNKTRILYLAGQDLGEIPDYIFKMENLEELNLNANQITYIPDGIRNLKNLKKLHLSNNYIKEINPVIFELIKLESFSIANNDLSDVSKSISKLKQLKILNLGYNNITSLPSSIEKLNELQKLFIQGNNLEYIPPWISSLKYLVALMLHKNPFNNPPPVEIIGKGSESLINYIKELHESEQDFIYEAKILILGEGGAGKTTLCKKVININYNLNDEEKTTEGIEIKSYSFPFKQKKFIVNIWDFGGQEIYHSTHQFFLTKRSLYVLVCDTRKEDLNFPYWLNIVELLSQKSPLVIIQNEKQDRFKELDLAKIKSRFDNVLTSIRVNFQTNRGMESLKSELEFQVSKLPHIGSALPKTWVDIRVSLENKQQSFISLDEYFSICSKFGINNRTKALKLSEFLHDLGVVLHFQDNKILKKILILSPDWGTTAVYKLLDHPILNENRGRFSVSDLSEIWHEDEYQNMYDELTELMTKFELCYQIGNSEDYIVPQLLRLTQPSYDWNTSNNIILKYSYQFMPKGILERLIVRLHRYIKSQDLVWKTGVLLHRDKTNSEIIQGYAENEIVIKLEGIHKKELLTIITEEFDKIHKTFDKLNVDKLIPCNCYECKNSSNPNFYSYDSLRSRISKGKSTIECYISYENIEVNNLIDDIFNLEKIKLSPTELKSRLNNEMSKGNPNVVIEELLILFKETENNQALKEVLVISSNLRQLCQEYNLNIIRRSEFSISKAKVDNALLNIIDTYI